MNNIKRFFDRVSQMDQSPGKNLVIPTAEARLLRDELAKLLVDKLAAAQSQAPAEVIQVEMTGGKFR
jgi:hypothetical protein